MVSRVLRSPNIWDHPDVYEIENLAVDRDGVLDAAMDVIRPWDGATVLDIGCGTGFHLPRFAERAQWVIGVEPHPPLLARARRRVQDLPAVQVRAGTAQALPVPDASVDLVHARWAYFFGPGCEAGLAEVSRVIRRGGAAFVIDNDPSRSTFGEWFRQAYPNHDGAEVERFWARQGWHQRALDIRWDMDSREDFEAVVRIEFPGEHAERILAAHSGRGVDYAVNLFWHTW